MAKHPERPSGPRKNPESFGFIFAWLEERRVCSREIDLLLPIHQNRWLRPQVLEKMSTLNLEDPIQSDLHRRVEQALDLFEAVHDGKYRPPKNWPELEPWLARALAYFIKTGDAIPDHFADGFEDDHREFVEMGVKLGALLDHFDAWRRHFGKPKPE